MCKEEQSRYVLAYAANPFIFQGISFFRTPQNKLLRNLLQQFVHLVDRLMRQPGSGSKLDAQLESQVETNGGFHQVARLVVQVLNLA